MKPRWPKNRERLFSIKKKKGSGSLILEKGLNAETVTYRLKISQRNYLTIVELKEHKVLRSKLKEELRQRLSSWVGLSGDENWREASGNL